MKVQSLFHIIQTVGSLSVERVKDTVFDLPDDDAVKAIAAGLVRAVQLPANAPLNGNGRKTKVQKGIESK
jgi:hypothetical protein